MATYGVPGIRTSTDHYLFLHFTENFMPTVLRANAQPAFNDARHIVSVGATANTTMYAFLATAAMHASWINPKLKPVAMRYYKSVVTSLRIVIATEKMKGDEDWLLLAINFLCLFEVCTCRI